MQKHLKSHQLSRSGTPAPPVVHPSLQDDCVGVTVQADEEMPPALRDWDSVGWQVDSQNFQQTVVSATDKTSAGLCYGMCAFVCVHTLRKCNIKAWIRRQKWDSCLRLCALCFQPLWHHFQHLMKIEKMAQLDDHALKSAGLGFKFYLGHWANYLTSLSLS